MHGYEAEITCCESDFTEKTTGYAVALELLVKNLPIGRQVPTAASWVAITFGRYVNKY